jgi:hypothetical protein
MKFSLSNRFSFEALLIVLSVLLGFGLSEWRQASADADLAERVQDNLRTEVGNNRLELESMLAQHLRLLEQIRAADLTDTQKSGWEVIFGEIVALGGGLTPPDFRQGAWDAAVSTGALRLLDYDLVADLSAIYRFQDSVDTRFTAMALGYEPDTFRPGMQSETVQVYRWTVEEVVQTENSLLKAYIAFLDKYDATQP